jgi:type IV pilus assembly protein PilM
MEVLLAVAQQDAINAHVQTLLASGLEPIAIDVQPLAVSRALIDVANGTLPYVVGIVNIGATTTDVGVFEGGLLTFPGPPLPIAGVNFTRAISEALGVPIEEAERLKKEYAEVDMSALQGSGMGGGTAYDIGAPAAPPAPAPEPDSYDTSLQQADSDFSPFAFDTPVPPPPQAQESKLDISGEDVFDLGGTQETPDFKPTFDLEEPEAGPAPAAPDLDFDIGGEPLAPPSDAGGQPPAAEPPAPAAQDTYAPAAQDQYAAAPAQDIRWKVINAIIPVLIELATEIRRSLDYYTTRYQSRPEQIFLCGGTARMRNLDQFLANELGIPVQVADPMANLAVQCPKYTPQYLREVSPIFPVSIGLAIREMLE